MNPSQVPDQIDQTIGEGSDGAALPPETALGEMARTMRHMAIDCERRFPMRAKKLEAMAKTIQKILKGDYD